MARHDLSHQILAALRSSQRRAVVCVLSLHQLISRLLSFGSVFSAVQADKRLGYSVGLPLCAERFFSPVVLYSEYRIVEIELSGANQERATGGLWRGDPSQALSPIWPRKKAG